MSLKRFFGYSVAFHFLIVIAIILFMPAVKERKTKGEFFTRLISPEELLQKPFIPSLPGSKSNHPASKKPSTAPAIEQEKYLPAKQESFRGPLSPPLREKIFDRNIIGDIAKKNVEKEKKERALTFDTEEYKFLIYNRRLKERIESIWVYPPDAAARGIYGDLVISFTIKKNGRLGAIEVLRTSGHQNLDDAAIKALKDGEPYWPLPDEWGMDAYTIKGHFIYTIYGYYIR
ncbi:MAG: energy transducer TonB [Nitrospirota bacterium]